MAFVVKTFGCGNVQIVHEGGKKFGAECSRCGGRRSYQSAKDAEYHGLQHVVQVGSQQKCLPFGG